MCTDRVFRRQGGVTLIELVLFIVIVSVGIAGILLVMNITTRSSADPMIRKQAVAIAESLLEEIELQPFTYCDVNDANATTARHADIVIPSGDDPQFYCATTVQGLGAGGKGRYADPQFDNVGNYHQFAMDDGIKSINNTAIGGLGNYRARIVITPQAIDTVPVNNLVNIPAADSLRIDVTVTAPNGEAITLTGYRFRYAPRAVP